jgi:hypothetical protein
MFISSGLFTYIRRLCRLGLRSEKVSLDHLIEVGDDPRLMIRCGALSVVVKRHLTRSRESSKETQPKVHVGI